MGYAIAAVIIIALIAACVWTAMAQAAKERERRALLVWEARQFMEDIKERRALLVVTTGINLKDGENAFYSEESELYETRAVRVDESVSRQRWTRIDAGTLTLTNKRLIFDGNSANRTMILSKVISAVPNVNGVEVSVENRQKSMVFDAESPLILASLIRICCQVKNPLDLSQVALNVIYDE